MSRSEPMQAGFLGVGKMGQPMARRFLEAGHAAWLYDIDDAAMQPLVALGGRKAASARQLADEGEIVVVSLPTLDAFRMAMTGPDGLLQGRRLKTVVNTCTVGSPFAREMAAACAERGVDLVDSPISGGPAGASAGTLAIMASGKPASIEALRPMFETWGKTIVVAGDEVGLAQVLKLTNNILFAVGLIATSEAMTMGAKGGLAPDAMLQVINNGTGRNYSSLVMFPNFVLPGAFDFGATIDILMKDVDLAIEQGESLGVPMWVCQAARLVLKHAVFQGRGQDDLATVVRIVEQGSAR